MSYSRRPLTILPQDNSDKEAKRRVKRPDFLNKYLKQAQPTAEGDVF
jgi:hypothetical protein